MKMVIFAVALVVFSLCSPAIAGEPSPAVDGHNHDVIGIRDGRLDLSRLAAMRSRGIDTVVVPLPLDRSKTSGVESRIVSEMMELRRTAATDAGFSIAGPDEKPGSARENDLRLLFSIEWFDRIFDGDPGRVERFRNLGVRIIGLVEKDPDGLFGVGDRSNELSAVGKRIVEAMNDTGVLIDITHLSHPQKLEIIRQSRAPVVATHSLTAEVSPTAFNLPDDVVAKLGETGGSVWVSFNASDLLAGDPDADALELLVDQIDALIGHLGPDHVGIGTDLQAGGRYVPANLNRDDTFSRIGRRLTERGYPQEVVDGVLGRNILNFIEDAGRAEINRPADESSIPTIEGVTVPADGCHVPNC
jgi:microsomal dipeptidase-like Zn-dependent dipeptidase